MSMSTQKNTKSVAGKQIIAKISAENTLNRLGLRVYNVESIINRYFSQRDAGIVAAVEVCSIPRKIINENTGDYTIRIVGALVFGYYATNSEGKPCGESVRVEDFQLKRTRKGFDDVTATDIAVDCIWAYRAKILKDPVAIALRTENTATNAVKNITDDVIIKSDKTFRENLPAFAVANAENATIHELIHARKAAKINADEEEVKRLNREIALARRSA